MNWKVLIAVSVGVLIVGLDMTVVNLAIPSIARHFSVSLSEVKWILTAYLVCGGSLVLFMSRLGDQYGLKVVYLFGLLVFTIFSFLCGISESFEALIFFRVCQGIGLAATFPILFAITSRSHERAKQGHAFGFVNVFSALSLGLGPIIGGVILKFLSWRWIFFLSVPISLLAFLLGIFLIDTTQDANEKDRFSYLSATLFTLGLGIILYALNQMVYWRPYSVEFIGCVLLGILLIVFMGVKESKNKNYFVPVKYFLKLSYLLALVVQFSAQFFVFGVLLIMPLFLENILLFSSFRSGLTLLFLTVAIAIASFFAGRILGKVKIKSSLFYILVTASIGAVLIALYPAFPYLIFLYLGFIFVAISTMPAAVMFMLLSLKQFPKCSTGSIFGIVYTVTFVSGAFGATMTSYVLSVASQARLIRFLNTSGITLSQDQINSVETVAEASSPLTQLSNLGAMAAKIKTFVLESFYHGYLWVFGMYLIFFGIAFICAIFFKEIEEIDEHTSPHESSAEINQ